MIKKLAKKEIIILIAIAVLFVVLHIPALNHPYHQDEYKWPIIVNPELTEPGGIPHPPVGEFIYRQAGFLVGYDNFRLVPFVFGLANLFLIFYLSKEIAGTKAALWTAGIFTLSFYSLLASLMVDTDGAILPFFFLIATIAYVKLKKTDFQLQASPFFIRRSVILVVAAILGFLTKASFVIGIAALAFDFAIEKNIFSDKKKIFQYIIFGIGGILFLGIILWASKLFFPYFKLEFSLGYWRHFFKFADRGWFQTFIQFAKVFLYSSPLLILPTVLIDREIFRRTKLFFLFIFIGLFFYLFAFDFSTGALDRYFQFLIVPLCLITGTVISRFKIEDIEFKNYILPIIIAVTIFFLQFFNHFAPSLYPKTDWIERIYGLRWNFLFPFSGGSGPTGFYISFAFMGLIWVCALIFAAYGLSKQAKGQALAAILILGLMYNAVFIEEYLFGRINGSVNKLFALTKAEIKSNLEIKKVVVYNDIGGYEIQKLGKYERRLYAAPQFEDTYRGFFGDFSGHVLYIDIPKIYEKSVYFDYMSKCKNILKQSDQYITAKILDCGK